MPKNTTLIKVTNQEFLEALFGDDWINVPVSTGDGWAVHPAGKSLKRLKPDAQNYFCVSTFTPAHDGKFVRQKQYFIRQHVFVVDDIGTKLSLAVAIDLFPPPTYIIETSPGNFQWGFKLTDGTDPRALSSLVDAVVGNAELNPSLRDPGMAGVTRVARPAVGSNVKPTVIEANGGKPFRSVMHSWRPERAYTVAEIAEAVGADLSETRLARYTAGMFASNTATPEQIAGDTVLKVFDAKGMVIDTDPNDNGFINVVCPWSHEHTDDRVEAGYKIGGGFQCHHGHCQHRTMDDVKKWIAEECREEHAAAIAEVFAAEPIDMARVEALQERRQEREAEAEEEHAEAAQQAEMTFRERYVYIKTGEGAIGDMQDRVVLSKAVFNDTEKRALPRRDKRSPVAYLNSLGTDLHVRGIGYFPGQGCIVEETKSGKTKRFFNTWQPHPIGPWALDPPTDKEVSIWLDEVTRIFPDKKIGNVFLDYCAFLLQCPGKKINWAFLLIGAQGVGKDLLLRPISTILGNDNVTTVNAKDFDSSYQDWAESELLVVEEVPPFHKRDFYESLKAIICASQPTIRVNKKFVPQYKINNSVNCFFFSNHDNAFAPEADDRRLLVYRTPAGKVDPEHNKRVADAFSDRMFLQKIRGWLEARDISAFNPFADPPMTEAKRTMIALAEDPICAEVRGLFEEDGEFHEVKLFTIEAVKAAINKHALDERDARRAGNSNTIAGVIKRALKGQRVEKIAEVRVPEATDPKRNLWARGAVETYEQVCKEKQFDKLRDLFKKEDAKRRSLSRIMSPVGARKAEEDPY